MMNRIISIAFHLANHLVSWITPKSDRIWIYGEWFGDKFCDNSSYAFKAGSTRNIKKIWITKNGLILERLRKEGYLCYHAHSVAGLYYQARAKIFFCSVNSKDFCFSSLTPRNIIFQMWHGLPLKKIGFDVKGRGGVKRLVDYFRSKIIDNYAYVISPSESFDKFFCSAFGVSSSKIIRSFYPRCDGLFGTEKDRAMFMEEMNIKTKRIIFYLPTHRNEGLSPAKTRALVDSIMNLNETLLKVDATLLVKPHFYEAKNIKNELCGNIIITNDLPFDLYKCLAGSDLLITDYSSVSLDYAITGKPIIYFMPDLDDYVANDRESYFDLSQLIQNPCRSHVDLSRAIEKLFIEDVRPSPIGLNIPNKDYEESITDRFQKIAESKVYGHK